MKIHGLTGVLILRLLIRSTNFIRKIVFVKQTFKKSERLNSKKQIEQLFFKNRSFFQFPFKVLFISEESAEFELPKVLITVSKRNIKRAVDRNKIKRLVREAYRKNKFPFIVSLKKNDSLVVFGLIYTAKTILSYAEIEKKIILILQRLIEQDEQTAG